jgi:Fanconi anemia group M protein
MLDFPKEFAEIRYLLNTLYENKIQELKSRSLLFGHANKIVLLKLQKYLASRANAGDGNSMAGMSLCAQAIKIAHAVELLETQTINGLNNYLEDLLIQASEKKSRAAQVIAKSKEFNAARISIKELIAKKIEHPKIEAIKDLLQNVIVNNSSKAIIFTQFRDTANTLVKTLTTDKIKPVMFVGQAQKERGGLSQKEQKKVVQDFKDGITNILCATSIGEEGLDIPEVSAVIFYEPIPSAIRKIQRTGRTARHAPGKLFILVTKDTRDEAYYYASAAREKKMYKLIEKVKSDMNSKNKITDFL